jgi:tetratricopeptide (TPR) repeat protein
MGWQLKTIVLLLCLVAAATNSASRAEVQEADPTSRPTDAEPASPPADAEAAKAAAKRIEAGRAAYAACDLEQAIADFSEALRVAPTAQAYALRGRAHAENGNDSQAWFDFDRAIELDPAQADAFAGRGWLHAMRGEYEPGFAATNEAIRLDPKHGDAYINRAALYRYTGRKDLGQIDDRTARHLDPTALDFRLPKGIFWGEERRDPRQIVAKCDEALRANERNFAAHMNRGFAHYLLNEHQESVEDYTAALHINPTYSQGYNYRGLAYMRLGKNDQAMVDLTKAIRFDPGFKWPYINRGSILSATDPKLALNDLNKALELDPRFNHALRNRMALYFEQRNFDAAIADASALVALTPEDWNYSITGYVCRAQCWLEREDYAAAMADLDETVRRKPSDAKLHAMRAWVYYKWGKLEQAIAEDAEARRLDPRYGRDYRALAEADRDKQN